jgi:hypothetical protein
MFEDCGVAQWRGTSKLKSEIRMKLARKTA